MIKYHGTPIGGKHTDAVEVLRGRHGLVSFAHPEQLSIVMDMCQSFVLDNGAFSKWKKTGDPIDFHAYVRWVTGIYRHPRFDWCLIPDVIDGDEDTNSGLVLDWVRMGLRAKGVPVWHLHESLEYLAWLVEDFEWVALGSSGEWPNPGTKGWWGRMNQAMKVCCDDSGRPKCKLHGLRMLNPEIFRHLPLASADSTNAAIHNNDISRFGMYAPPSAGARAAVIASRIEAHNSAAQWGGRTQHELFG